MRKTVHAVLATVFLLAVLSSGALAAQDVGNPSQKGSLLIWPKIVVERVASRVTVDTVVTIANDYFDHVYLKCYWMDEEQNTQDFMFRITRGQVVWFRASDGSGMDSRGAVELPPFDAGKGELKCWAVNEEGDDQISWNHLFGTATVYDYGAGTAREYSSWNFSARVPVAGDPVGTTPGELELTGAAGAYDACPDYLLGTFMADGAVMTDVYDNNTVSLAATDLTLSPCKQDLRQDRTPTYTKAQFDIWNEDEVKATGTYICLKCWLETTLEPVPVTSTGAGPHRNFDRFGIFALHTTMGFFRVYGVFSTQCAPWVTQKTPLIGVISKKVAVNSNPAASATHLNTAGAYRPVDANDVVRIWWDPEQPHWELNRR